MEVSTDKPLGRDLQHDFLTTLADSLDDQVSDEVKRARKDVNFFCGWAMQTPKGEYWGEQQRHHREWQDAAGLNKKGGWQNNRLVIFAPPETAKSSQLVVGRLLWLLGNDPNLRAAIVCDVDKQAQKFVSEIRSNIMNNERLQMIFPNLKPESRSGRAKRWSDDGIILQRNIISKDFSVQALGVRGALLSARLDLLILDDILSWENTLTKYQLEKTINWFLATAVGRVVKGGQIALIGLTWDHEDLLNHLAEHRGYECFRYSLLDEGDPRWKRVDWPEVWPRDRVESMTDELGPFESARQLRQRLPSRDSMPRPFPKSACEKVLKLSRAGWSNSHFGENICGVDLATRKGKTTDYTCFFTISASGGFRQVLNIFTAQLEGPKIIEVILDIHRRFRPLFVVENNSAQIYIEQFVRDGRVLEAFGATPAEARGIRIKGRYTGSQSLDRRFGIPALGVDFETGKWGAPDHSEVNAWLKECYNWFPGQHPGDRLAASHFANEESRTYGGLPTNIIRRIPKESALNWKF